VPETKVPLVLKEFEMLKQVLLHNSIQIDLVDIGHQVEEGNKSNAGLRKRR
jgi:hypothetical protein